MERCSRVCCSARAAAARWPHAEPPTVSTATATTFATLAGTQVAARAPGHYVPAQMIEESVIEHLRGGNLQHAAARKLVKAYAAGTRAPELVALAGAAIHSVFYDGATEEVVIRLRSAEDADAGKR